MEKGAGVVDLSLYWKTIVDTLQDGVMVVDARGQILAVNPAVTQMTGYAPSELIGRSCRMLDCTGCDIIGKGSGKRWCGLFVSGGVRAKRCVITTKDQREVTIIKNAAILRDPQGNAIGAVETLKDMSEIIRQQEEISSLRKSLHMEEGYHGMLGRSLLMQALFELIENVAQSEAPVLISGESGTGKELVARAVHDAGPRRDKPFTKVNCAALNENLLESELFGHAKGAYTGAERARIGRFEAAHGGTIFLDEIGDIPLSIQVKLLRVLEEREIERVGEQTPIKVDVRILSATNRDLDQMVSTGAFRDDLFFRINVFPLHCPSLRRRKEDIPAIVQSFIRVNAEKSGKPIGGLSAAAMAALERYDWPGNIRELRNAVEYAFVLCPGDTIDLPHLPARICQTLPVCRPAFLTAAPTEEEKGALVRVLQQCDGNQSQAARLLGISRVTLWKRIKKSGLDVKKEVRG
jgi:PAS domain S-box-containing protein